MNERKKLSDILRGSDRDALPKKWKDTEAAKELEPLPPGEYLFRILSGELFNAKTGTPGYKLTLEVAEGEYEGRRAWHDIYLTDDALKIAKRDLPKIGVTDLKQLEQPLPAGILIRAKVVRRKSDSGTDYNKIDRFEAAGIEAPGAFAPPPEADDKEQQDGANASGESFPFGAHSPPRNGIAPGPYDRSERR